MKTKCVSIIAIVNLLVCRAYSYGPEGHSMVGAIADEKLAVKPAGKKVTRLLGGVSLAEAALLPDKIKDWDGKVPGTIVPSHLIKNKKLAAQFLAFWEANPPSHNDANTPSHHIFHYTDVPVLDLEKYSDGQTGRNQFDIVHMIPFCIRVLTGEESDQNPRKITRPVAVALLAHYVGDIHQPLHVGAEYFDKAGHPADPDKGVTAIGDEGGNGLTLVSNEISDHGHTNNYAGLHHYWDNQTVTTAFELVRMEVNPAHPATVKTSDIAHHFATQEPANWKLGSQVNVKDWSEKWADEILPVAQEAHERLEFSGVHENAMSHVANGFANEKPMAGGKSYKDWAGSIVKVELHRAGWRLADLLESALK
jgi:hypothetical protein